MLVIGKLKTRDETNLIMKLSNLSKFIGASIFAASVAVLPFHQAAVSQTETAPDTTGTTTAPGAQVQGTDYENNNDFDWGWLGLLGLAGLAGLAGRKRDDRNDVHYRATDEVGSTTYRR